MIERSVSIIGCGMTPFGEHWSLSLEDLIAKAAKEVLQNVSFDETLLDAIYIGSMASGSLAGQTQLAALVTDIVKMYDVPVTRVEAACASGGMALRQGYLAIASGVADVVLVIGAEKMTDMQAPYTAAVLATAGHGMQEAAVGASFPALYALMACAHMHAFGTTEEHMALCAVKNHSAAVHNPYAQFKKAITVADVMQSGYVATPLKLLDCSPITDGAAAVLICSTEFAHTHGYRDCAVQIIASSQSHDTLALADRSDLCQMSAVNRAAQNAYEQACINPSDIDCAEVHDCFTIAELLAIEGLGFCPQGQSGVFVASGATTQLGSIPVNMSGGLKAKGHPVGATGVAQAVEIYEQLLDRSGLRQVQGATTGLTLNVGGSGATAIVHILRKE
jgi:acetyl-CoA C-acetyltransferase